MTGIITSFINTQKETLEQKIEKFYHQPCDERTKQEIIYTINNHFNNEIDIDVVISNGCINIIPKDMKAQMVLNDTLNSDSLQKFYDTVSNNITKEKL